MQYSCFDFFPSSNQVTLRISW